MQSPSPTRKRILVVDDDPQIHLLIREALHDGYEVAGANNGAQAIDMVMRQRPDLVLLDIIMPEVDGLECLQRLCDVAPGLRVIMITGQSSSQTVLASLRRQAFDYLPKPFSVVELRTLVEEALDYTGPVEFRVISATPQWVEVETPCSLASARRLYRFLCQLKTGLAPEVQDEVAGAFRELLQNAVEHGGKHDANQRVRICFLRLAKVLVYAIRDPGQGFQLEQMHHAAIGNPPEEPMRHVKLREQMNLRPGGFGLFLAKQLVDELVYNQKRNEVIFVKYLP